MSRSVNLKISQEREKGGLIILEAHYGLASAFSERGIRRSRPARSDATAESAGAGRTSDGREEGVEGVAEEEEEQGEKRVEEEEVVVDVTVPVQALVVDSKLSIPGGRGKVSFPHILQMNRGWVEH